MNFLEKAAKETKCEREIYDDSKIPTDPKKITLMPFFGDLRSLFVFSTILANRIKKPYLIICSWSGFGALFPYANEFWGVKDNYEHGFRFNNEKCAEIARNLNFYFFENIIFPEKEFSDCYYNGIKEGFWLKYKEVKRFLPRVENDLSRNFQKDLSKKGRKIFIYPSKTIYAFSLGNYKFVKVSKEFWIELIKYLGEDYIPVIYKGLFTYDLSECKGIHFAEKDIGQVLSAMRATGCVLDIFNGISRLAIAARCPFLAFDERMRFNLLKDYEMDDICASNLHRRYVYSFANIITNGNKVDWENNIFTIIKNKLEDFPFNEETSVIESSEEIIPYQDIRVKTIKKLGTRLLKIPRE